MRKLRVAGVLVTIAFGVSAATTPTVAAPVGDHSIRVATFNIWGNAGHRGQAGWIADAIDEVLPQAPAALALQEACRNQAQEFATQMGMRMEFLTLIPHRCDNGQDFGNAVLYRGTASGPVVRRMLPGAQFDEPRGVVCVPLRQFLFCSIHLTIVRKVRSEQTKWLAAVEAGEKPDLPPLRQWGAVVLAGDFNADPRDAELDPLYDTIGAEEALGPRGVSTVSTHDDGRKIDYVFTWGRPGSFQLTGSLLSSYSDHRLYTTWYGY
jgi:endonuclease/exonuclease/phosphatase family metal-dependent hydrolase